MTVNLVSQFAIQADTTFAQLRRILSDDTKPWAGMSLLYSRAIDDQHCLQGSLAWYGGSEPFERGVTARLGAWWRTFTDKFNPFEDDVTDLLTPEWATSVRVNLLSQRGGFVTLLPRLEQLHAERYERLRDTEWFDAYPPKREHAWRELPVVDYLEATGLLGTATFSLVPGQVAAMAGSVRVRHD